MKEITSYDDMLEILREEENILVYVHTPTCGICLVDFPKILEMTNKMNLPLLKVDATQASQIVGQLEVFTIPAVILFNNNKEIHRQARIINFEELEYRIKQVLE